jgi:hypothetical protein
MPAVSTGATKDIPPVCYLCGLPLVAPTNQDHVPPKQLYTAEIRKAHRPNLLTIKVHMECNRSYQIDEDYFVNTLAPFAAGSYSGNSLLQDVARKYAQGVGRVLEEFERRPSGIVLPDHLVAKRFDGNRLHRVAWKIVRGLYFHRHRKVLPELTPNHLEMVSPDRLPPKEFLMALWDTPSQGQYPGVFDYKFATFPQLLNFNYWAMLLWDRVILIMSFHDPTCTCSICLTPTGQKTPIKEGFS